MTLPPRLDVATFRGVRFTCTSHKTTAGRRLADHEFPQRDLGYHEDLGRKDRDYTLEAYLTGDDVDAQRSRLLVALEQPGPGELFHPWLGRLWVAVRPGTISETRTARRLITLSLTFVEAGRPQYPTVAADTKAAVATAAATLNQRAAEGLRSRYDQTGTPSYVKQDAADRMEHMAVASEMARLQLGSTTEDTSYVAMRAIDDFVLAVPALVPDSDAIAAAMGGVMDALATLPADPAERYAAFEGAFSGAILEQIGNTATPNRRRLAANGTALTDTIRQIAAARATSIAAAIRHDTYDQAVAMRGRVADWLDREAIAASRARDDRTYRAIGALKSAYVAHVTATSGTLSELRAITLKRARPSLAVAYAEHADARRADEIVRRNAIIHPGFCPAGVPLQVLGR